MTEAVQESITPSQDDLTCLNKQNKAQGSHTDTHTQHRYIFVSLDMKRTESSYLG